MSEPILSTELRKAGIGDELHSLGFQIWPEKTDPKKFVYEDIAIASYLIVSVNSVIPRDREVIYDISKTMKQNWEVSNKGSSRTYRGGS